MKRVLYGIVVRVLSSGISLVIKYCIYGLNTVKKICIQYMQLEKHVKDLVSNFSLSFVSQA